MSLIIYWQYDYRRISTLNPIIAVNTFANNINTNANKGLNQKLNGKKLQLVVEQVPHYFSFVDKAHLIWLVYPISWDKIYMEPDFNDMVITYQILENETSGKSGKIVIKNNAQNKKLGVYQSWKSSISNHIASYNAGINTMAKEFTTKLLEEL